MGVWDLALAGGTALVCAFLLVALLRQGSVLRRQRAVVEHLPDALVTTFDRELRVTSAAGPALAAAGTEPEAMIGRPLAELVPQAKAEALLEHFRAALRGEDRSFGYRVQRTGREYWVRTAPLLASDGSVAGGLSLALDITDSQQAERDVFARAADVRAVTDATRSLARSLQPTAAREAVCRGATQVADAPVAALFEPRADEGALVAEASAGADLRGLELPADGPGGAAIAFSRAEEVFVSLGHGEAEPDREFMRVAGARAILWYPVVRDRAAIGVLAIAWRSEMHGVSLRLSGMIDLLGAEAAVAIARADLLGHLEHMARTDSLTGLPNRRHWEQHLPRELARALREESPLCVAMLDLDHFKDYNDRRGHQAGDQLLGAAAGAWRRALRPYDVLARYGGEEFAVILPACELADAIRSIERLRAQTPQGETCSAGIAEWDREEEPDALVGRADAALYGAKRAGRNRTVTATPAPAARSGVESE
jgi:diguanylate cyclase (GGDEF)-like protein/PAS domain S-box-containing protein